MEEARAVLSRLERIEALERRGAAPGPLLQELRELAREVAIWAEREADPRASRAAAALLSAVEPRSRRPHETQVRWPFSAGPRPSDSAPHPVRR